MDHRGTDEGKERRRHISQAVGKITPLPTSVLMEKGKLGNGTSLNKWVLWKSTWLTRRTVHLILKLNPVVYVLWLAYTHGCDQVMQQTEHWYIWVQQRFRTSKQLRIFKLPHSKRRRHYDWQWRWESDWRKSYNQHNLNVAWVSDVFQ